MFYDIAMTPAQLAAITDVETLRAVALQWVAEKVDAIAQQQRIIDAHELALASRQRHIDALTLELARLRRLRFAARTETLSALQRSLFEETLAEEIGAAEQALEQAIHSIRAVARPEVVTSLHIAARPARRSWCSTMRRAVPASMRARFWAHGVAR